MPTEKLVCNCKREDGSPDDSNHHQHQHFDIDGNLIGNEIIVECSVCGRFLKFDKPQPGVPHRDELKK